LHAAPPYPMRKARCLADTRPQEGLLKGTRCHPVA